MTARLLRWLLVDGPVRLGAWRTAQVRLLGLVVGAWLVVVAFRQPFLLSLAAGAVGLAGLYVAGWVWQWRIQVQQRKAVRR